MNEDFLLPNKFLFKMNRLNDFELYVTECNLPGVTAAEIPVGTPFKKLPIPGDRLEFNELTVTFKVAEDLSNYFAVWDWINALTFPESFDEYKTLVESDEKEISDATLVIMKNSNTPNYEIVFEDMFPVSMGDIQFTHSDSSAEFLSCEATFAYKIWNYKKI